ncbi:MAG: hypothetical protein N2444_01435 [Methylocystis sp.]|nr:hypothetical protein [Methylocystis sp.]
MESLREHDLVDVQQFERFRQGDDFAIFDEPGNFLTVPPPVELRHHLFKPELQVANGRVPIKQHALLEIRSALKARFDFFP